MPNEINLVADKRIPHVRYGIYPYNTVTEEHAIYLPMPGGLTTSDDAEWEAEDNWGMVAAEGAGKVVATAQSGMETGSGGKGGPVAYAKGGAQAVKDVGKIALNIAGNALGQISPTTKALARGKTVNLQKEHFYKGKAFRTFTFTHNLNADSAEDSLLIREVIKLFRLASSPGMDHIYFTWPSDIIPRFFTGEIENELGQVRMVENTWLPKLEKCVIKGVEVNYAPQEPYHQHRDGSPTMLELQLELEEIVQQTRQVINTPHGSTRPLRPDFASKFKEAQEGSK